jgi:hypothetical protein
MLQALAWGVFSASVTELDRLLAVNRALQAGSRQGLACAAEAD